MPTKRRSANVARCTEKFEDTLTDLVSRLTFHSRDIFVTKADQIPKALANNNYALQLLNQAAQVVYSELNKCHRPKMTAETEHRRALRRFTFSWELIPGLSCVKHSFAPLDLDDSDKLLELALKNRDSVLIVGSPGQGKTMLLRYVIRKLFRLTVFADMRDIDDLNVVFRRFAELSSGLLVLDNLLACHCETVRQNLLSIPSRSTICMISTSDEVFHQLSNAVYSVRIPDPCQQHLARLYTLLARCVNSTPKFLIPTYRTRLSIVRSVQMELLDIQLLCGDYADVDVDSLPPERQKAYFNRCFPVAELRKLERITPPKKKTKGKKGLKKKQKKTKKKDKKKPRSRIKECFTV